MGNDANHAAAAVSRGFIESLQRLYLMAGRPKFKQLEILSLQRPDLRDLCASTTHDILTGKRSRLPELAWVISFVTVCWIHAEQINIGTGQFGTVEDWYQRWLKATSACRDTAPWPVHAGPVTDDDHHTGPFDQARDQIRKLIWRADTRFAARHDTTGDPHLGDETSRAAVLALTRHAATLGWWQDYRDVVPDWLGTYLSLEPAASLIRTYETDFIPGLLQTEEYANAVIRLGHRGTGSAAVRRRVELRMRRQQILHRANAPTLWVVIDENAFHHPRISATTMRDQVKHLIAISQQTKIVVQVMPADSPHHATAGGPITILRFPERELPEVGYLEQVTHGLYPDTQADINHYRQVLDRLGLEARRSGATTRILNRILTDP